MLTRNSRVISTGQVMGAVAAVSSPKMAFASPSLLSLCAIGGFDKKYGIPGGYNPSVAYFPALSPGGMTSRLLVLPTFDVDIMGLGLVTGDASVVLTFYANLAGVKWAYSDLVCHPEFWANLIGYGYISSDLSIGSRPSAEDIIYALMDTPVGNPEGDISFRETLRLFLAVAAGKTNIGTDIPIIVKFRDIGDTKDRITAEMDKSERVAIELDLS